MGKIDDLTVREVNEAKGYGLSLEQYVDLKEKFSSRQRDRLVEEVRDQAKKEAKSELRNEISSEMRPNIRIDVEKEMRPKLLAEIEKELRAKLPDELRPKLRGELLPEVRKQVEAELGAQLRTEARTEAKQEMARELPSAKDRRSFREFVREEEVDCLTQANAASFDADKAESALRWGRRLRVPMSFLLFIGLPIFGFFLHTRFGEGPGFWTFLLPAIFAAVSFAIAVGTRQENLKEAIQNNRKVASNYWVLAERAKKLRMVVGESAQTRDELRQEVNSYAQAKQGLDNTYFPAATSLTRARQEIREQLLSEVDPDKLFRVATEPEPEELDEAEAEVTGGARERTERLQRSS